MHRKLSTILVVLMSALVAAGCGEFGNTEGSSGGGGAGTNGDSDEPRLAAEGSFEEGSGGCGKVENMKNFGQEHVEEEVKYEQNPPTSGKHNPSPLPWGIYKKAEAEERWVHNLEHGHIVVLHDGLSKKEVAQLHRDVRKVEYHVNVFPRKANPKDGVYYLAWRTRLYCEKHSREALQHMIDEYRDQGPELLMQDQAKGSGDDE